MKGHCNIWKCSHRIGLFLVILYILCFGWYFVRTVSQDLHLQVFQQAFIGFTGMNLLSFILGAVQVYVWAYIGVTIWHLVGCCHKEGSCENS